MSKNIYYVYIHTRLDTGEVFYVGKGSGNRERSKHSRNRYWHNVVSKTEWISSVVQCNMSEEDSLLLEMWLIAKFRHSGVKLCNMTDGGDGVRMDQPSTMKMVVCSNGMEFDSINAAAKWAGVGASKISSVVNGRRVTSGGFSWWLKGEAPIDYVSPTSRMGKAKKIYRSDGVCFESIKDAADSVGGDSANLSSCARGLINTAYGFAWSYDSVPDEPISRYDRSAISLGIPLICIDTGEEFPSASHAARWVSSVTDHKSATGWPISCCAKGRSASAYGFKWRYVE